MTELLHLLGQDGEDIAIVSALCQDMVVRAGDVGYDAQARRFALIGNRFRWEADEKSRVRSALRFDGVLRAQCRNWPAAPGAVLDLLSIAATDDCIELDFAGGISIRLTVEAVDVMLEDLSGPWGARAVPRHLA